MSLSNTYSKWDKFAADIDSDSDSDEDVFKKKPVKNNNNNGASAATTTTANPTTTTAVSNAATAAAAPAASKQKLYDDIPDLVKTSCAKVAEVATLVHVSDPSVLSAFASSLDVEYVQKYARTACKLHLPFRFETMEMATFTGLAHALNFGRGWSKEIAALPNQDTSSGGETESVLFSPVLYALVGAVIEGNKLGGEDLAAMSQFHLSQLLHIPLTQESVISGPLRQDVASPFRPLLDRYHGTVQEVSRVCRERNFDGLGRFLLSTAANGLVSSATEEGTTNARSCVTLVSKISSALPSFRDEYVYQSSSEAETENVRVALYSRAFALVAALHYQGSGAKGGVTMTDFDKLSPPAMPTLIGGLVRHNLLQIDPKLQEALSAGKELHAGSRQEIELRACAVHATHKLAELTEGKLTAFEIGLYLNGEGRAEPNNPICKDTIHY